MISRRSPAPATRGMAGAAFVLSFLSAACSTSVTPTAVPTPTQAAPTSAPTLVATPRPTPTPAPTPRFTNAPDSELQAIFPASVGGVPLVIVPVEEFGLTPGDVGAAAYGELGVRFVSLAIAYVEQPRLTLYAMRADGPPIGTEELEPYLASAGRYVGVAGLERAPWELTEAGGHLVWARPEDEATAAGTRIYTWAGGEFVFLLIGVDDALNRGLIAALPGEPPPSPTPSQRPSTAPSPSASGG